MQVKLYFYYIWYKIVYFMLFITNDRFLRFLTKDMIFEKYNNDSSDESENEELSHNTLKIEYAILVDKNNYKAYMITNKVILLIYLNCGLYINHINSIVNNNFNQLFLCYQKNDKSYKVSIDLENSINLDTQKKIYFNQILSLPYRR